MGTLYKSDSSLIGDAASIAASSYVDEMLSPGSLVLLDMAHSTLSDAERARIPVYGETLTFTNIAAAQAAVLTSADPSTLNCPIASNFLSADMAFERTTKGGLHGACSRSGMSAGRNATIKMADPIKTYILANPTHRYFVALEGLVTRKALYSSGNTLPFNAIANASGSTVNFLQFMTAGDNSGTELGVNNGAELGQSNYQETGGGVILPGPNTEAQAFYRDSGSFRWQNSVPVGIGNLEALLAIWGAYGAWATVAVNKAASWVLYRAYVEDLTVSGRSYEDASNLALSIWKRNTSAGGRWHGDTFTAAATLKP